MTVLPSSLGDEQLRPRRSGPGAADFVSRSRPDEDSEDIVTGAVARAKAGDREALSYLYVRYADSVYGYVRNILRDQHEAEDVTQDVFAKLMRVLHKYEDRGLQFHPWVLRVARNLSLDRLRSRRAIPSEEIRLSDEQEDSLPHEGSSDFEEALFDLPEDQRSVLFMRHVVGLSPGEIAEHLGRTEGSVHGLHHRGREAMRQTLERLHASPSVRRAPSAAASALSLTD